MARYRFAGFARFALDSFGSGRSGGSVHSGHTLRSLSSVHGHHVLRQHLPELFRLRVGSLLVALQVQLLSTRFGLRRASTRRMASRVTGIMNT